MSRQNLFDAVTWAVVVVIVVTGFIYRPESDGLEIFGISPPPPAATEAPTDSPTDAASEWAEQPAALPNPETGEVLDAAPIDEVAVSDEEVLDQVIEQAEAFEPAFYAYDPAEPPTAARDRIRPFVTDEFLGLMLSLEGSRFHQQLEAEQQTVKAEVMHLTANYYAEDIIYISSSVAVHTVNAEGETVSTETVQHITYWRRTDDGWKVYDHITE